MAVTNGYCTVDELRGHFGDDPDDAKLPTADLERAINATSRAIDNHCGRRFWQDPADALTTRRYLADDWYQLDVADISTADGLIVATAPGADGTWSTTWTATDYQLEPLDVDVDHPDAYAWTRLVAVADLTWPVHARRATVRVTARHGWSAVPAGVTAACILRAAAIFKRREAVFGVAGLNGFGEVRITRRDPDVMALLHDYVRIRVGVV